MMPRLPIGRSTSDLHLHGQEFITKFIDAFRKHPCLWNMTHPEYKNQNSKLIAYNRMLKIAKEIEPKTTIADIKKKIQSIRASHRKERNKVVESITHAQSPDEIYVPRLWYYKDLEFLNQMEETCEKNHSGNISENNENSISDVTSETHSITIDDLEIKEEFVSGDENIGNYISNKNYDNKDNKSILSDLSLASTDSMRDLWDSPPPSTSKRFKPNSPQMSNQPSERPGENYEPIKDILSYITEKIDNNRDECDIFGKNVASELRNMTSQQRIIAKKLMNDVIFHGQLQRLTVDTQIQINHFFAES